MKKLVIAFVLLIGTGCAVEGEFADDQLWRVLASDEGGTDGSQPPAFRVAMWPVAVSGVSRTSSRRLMA